MKTGKHTKMEHTESALCRMLLALTGCVVVLIFFLALPGTGQAQNAEHGKELFEKRCSGCHALDREKEGPPGWVVSMAASPALCRPSNIRTRLRPHILPGTRHRWISGWPIRKSLFPIATWRSS